MIRRNTWVLLGIFGILVAVVLVIPRWEQANPQATPTAAAPQANLLPAVQGKPVEIQVVSREGKSLTITTTDQTNWTVKEPGGLEYNADKVNGAGNGLGSAVILNDLPQQPPADAMGLTNPTATIVVKVQNGAQKTIKVGNVTPAGSGYYVQMDANRAVIINKSVVDDLVSLLTSGTPPVTPTPLTSQTPNG
jgi:hypothetical protein